MAGEADTIFAAASGAGRAAVAVLRLSGPGSAAILRGLCGRLPVARRATLMTLRDGTGGMLDRALVLWFAAPRSYTGEDAGELHLHAGPAVIAGVAERLAELGARPAEPGEFTRRAFLNGRMDLLAAEAVADLVAAETAEQRRQALRQLEGGLGQVYAQWTARLTRLVAQQEALIDFPDDALPPEIDLGMAAERAALRAEIAAHLDDGRRGERLRDGLVFAVAGPPNVGKSTLVNVLAGREVAIVSPVAGTTRDVLEARLVLDGVPVTMLDMAGLRQTADPIEAEGVRRAAARMASADLVLVLRQSGSAAMAVEMSDGGRTLRVATKCDLGGAVLAGEIAVSAATGYGIDRLHQSLAQAARELTGIGGPPALTRPRHRAALAEAAAALAASATAGLPELCGEELRLALAALGRITGRVGTEAILDSVFGQFCIGK